MKDPYVLEFAGIPQPDRFLEKDLEGVLIDKLQQFLLELGKGFAFMGGQQRITLDGTHFFIDLVFYNRLARCFVLIDLKVGELTHQDLGQMQMYVNYYQREMTVEGENPPIGIVLCAEKNDAVVRYTLPEGKKQIFASRYKLYLPTEEELAREEERYHELTWLKEPVERLHNGYFAQGRKGVLKDTRGDSQADDEVYNLIMKDKERLLSLDEPLRFIFSHSALREGWDNPNVFQICTLNETRSVVKKRQEIGRGLRLPVDQNGVRVFDESVNKLYVMANEIYAVDAIRGMAKIEAPKVRVSAGQVHVAKGGVSTTAMSVAEELAEYGVRAPPDILAYLQNETELTRSTLVRILKESGRLGEIFENPQRFLDAVAAILKHELHRLLVNGIKYERLPGDGPAAGRRREAGAGRFRSRLGDGQGGFCAAVSSKPAGGGSVGEIGRIRPPHLGRIKWRIAWTACSRRPPHASSSRAASQSLLDERVVSVRRVRYIS